MIIFSISQSEQCLSEFFLFHNYCLHVHGCLWFPFVKSTGISQSKHSGCSSSLKHYLLFRLSDCFCFIIIFLIFKSEYTILSIIITFQILFVFLLILFPHYSSCLSAIFCKLLEPPYSLFTYLLRVPIVSIPIFFLSLMFCFCELFLV